MKRRKWSKFLIESNYFGVPESEDASDLKEQKRFIYGGGGGIDGGNGCGGGKLTHNPRALRQDLISEHTKPEEILKDVWFNIVTIATFHRSRLFFVFFFLLETLG